MATFTITRTLKNPGEKFYTNSVICPPGLTLARITIDVPDADKQDPTTNCSAGIEFAPVGTTDAQWPTVARNVVSGTFLGHPTTPLDAVVYVEIGPKTLAFLAGKLVRGFLVSQTAGKEVGAVLEVT